MLLYFIRHGDPDYANDSLTPLGKRQAEAVARRLSIHGVDKIYSSPLGRAKETAKPTSEMLRLPIGIEEWCSENLAWQDFSQDMPGGGHTWVFNQHPDNLHNPETMALGYDRWYEAECFSHINAKAGIERIQKASDDFFARQGYVREGTTYRIERPNNERIALFAHQGFGTIWLSVLLQIPPQFFFNSFDITHTGITVIQFENRANGYTQPKCLVLSDTSHLYEDRLPLKYNNWIEF